MIRYIYFSFFIAILAHNGAFAFDFPKKGINGYELRDLSLPYDFAPADALDLPIILHLAKSPADLSKSTLDAVAAFKALPEGSDKAAKEFATTLGFKLTKINDLSNAYPAALINKQLGVKLDSVLDFIPAKFLRQYAEVLISATSILEKDPYRASTRGLYFSYGAAPILARVLNPYIFSNINEYDWAVENSRDSLNRVFSAFEDAKYSSVTRLGLDFYSTLLNIVAANIKVKDLLEETVKTTVIHTRYGRIAIGGKGDDTYKGSFTLIIDIGGNDKYDLSTDKLASLQALPARAIVDFSGNDVYAGDNFSLAGAYFGINALIDLAGDDTYTSGSFGQACAIAGCAILHDFSGNDKYKCDYFGQGFAALGAALLIDEKGNDTYACAGFSQGVGTTGGYGVMLDKTGDDKYMAEISDTKGAFPAYYNFSQGAGVALAGSTGGRGLLIDLAGNDSYSAQGYSQGAARSRSFGALADMAGNDTYNSNYYSQAASEDFAFAALLDQSGDDQYSAQVNSVGFARGISAAEFYDGAGSDSYFADSLCFGSGSSSGVVFVTDELGVAHIETAEASERNYNGLFLRYIGAKFVSRAFLGEDAETFAVQKSGSIAAAAGRPEKKLVPRKKYGLPNGADSLASLAAFSYDAAPEISSAAIERIKSKLEVSSQSLYKYMPSQSFAMRAILADIFASGGSKLPASVSRVMVDSLRSRSFPTRSIASESLAKDKDERLIDALNGMIDYDKDWRLRALAARGYGEMRDAASISALAIAARDAHPIVRYNAIYSIGKLNPQGLSFFVKPALTDSSKMVRETAQNLMQNMDTEDVSDIIALLQNGLSYESELRYIAKLSGAVRSKGDFAAFLNYLKNQNDAKRKIIYQSIAAGKNKFWKTHLPTLVKNEENPELKEMLSKIRY